MIGKTQWQQNGRMTIFYVAQLPGQGGKDWGWTERYGEAILLSVYWQRRFTADQRHCGRVAYFVPWMA